jgi:PhnB protein
MVDDAARAIEFYTKAFGAKERSRSGGPGGKIMHAEILVGDSVFMISDEFPGMSTRSPKSLGGTTGGVWLYVPDTDAMYQQALAAGAVSVQAPVDMFWGDRHARIRDPFGHQWSLATHVEDVPVAEMQKREAEFMKQMASRGPGSP